MKNNLHNKNIAEGEFDDNNMEQKILDKTARFQVPFTLTNDEAWEKLQTKIAMDHKLQDNPKGKKLSMLYYITSAAAVVLALFGIWQFILRTPVKDIVAPKGQHAEYQLPEGSRISLNAESKVSYNKRNFNKSRNVSMEGEAFFTVKKGSTFTINTKHANIKILGTSFNVYARENSFKVSCLTGKIMVTSGKQSFIIMPGESAKVENDKLIKSTEKNVQSIANWRNGEFNYENTPLNIVFEEIERQFNVTFVLSKTGDRIYTGGFDNRDLNGALTSVCDPMGLTYEIRKNSQIYIYEKK